MTNCDKSPGERELNVLAAGARLSLWGGSGFSREGV